MKGFFKKIGAWIKNHLPTKRRLIQLYTALLYNANIKGFFNGSLFNGKTKQFCLPGLNCYSCPGSIGSCPLGTLQNALTNSDTKWPAYVFGIIILFGLLLGRTICGFLCPIGLGQELLYKIPTPKAKKSVFTRILSYLKYVILIVMVVLLPLMYMDGSPVPTFCKYICPAGLIEGAFPLLPNNEGYFDMLGVVFSWKFLLFVAFVVLAVVFYRFFCRFLCPLGAIYGLFAKLALLGIKLDQTKCTDCGLCIAACKMDIKRVGDHECIQCGECIAVCPTKAISWKGSALFVKPNELEAPTAEGKPLTAFVSQTSSTEEVGQPTAVQTESVVEGLKMVDSVPQPMRSITEARKKEQKRNKALEATAWILAGTVLAGALIYANWIVPSPERNKAPTGTKCEDFTLSLYGEEGEFTLSQSQGKATVLTFWYADKLECEEQMPYFNEAFDEYAGAVNFIAVHSEETYGKDVAAWIAENKDVNGNAWADYRFAFAQDKKQASGKTAYEALGGDGAYPFTVIIDGAGLVRYASATRFENGEALRKTVDDTLYGYTVGSLCRDFTVQKFNAAAEEETFTLSNYRGKLTVVNFWHITCSGCIAEMPHINEVYEEYADKIEVVALHNYEYMYTESKILQFIATEKDGNGKGWKDYSITFAQDAPQATDPDGREVYKMLGGTDEWPRTIFINEYGYIVYNSGYTFASADELRALIESNLP